VPQPARGDKVAEIIDRAAGDGSSGMSGAAFGLFPRPPRVRVKSGEDKGSSLQTAQSPNPSLDYKVDSHQVITCHELHVEVSMCTPLRLIIIAGTVLLGAVETGSAATTRAHHPARVPSAAPVQGNWCLYYHAGGANCRFADFQGCMYAAQAYGGKCQLSPSWRARYGDRLPPLERWQYGGTPDYCVNIDDARCY
jgi:hypothetical protein